MSEGFLRKACPPTGSVQVGRWTLEGFGELRLLRASLRQATGGLTPDGGGWDTVSEKLAIVATELAANAIAHAKPPTTVQLLRTEATFVLDVADNDPWVIPEFAEERLPRGGRLGLHMARRVSLDMGWYADEGTKHVWAQIAPSMPRRAAGDDVSRRP